MCIVLDYYPKMYFKKIVHYENNPNFK